MNFFICFLLTFLAGISTVLGFFIIFINKTKQNKIIISALAFSSSVMFFVSFLDLLPESYELLIKDFNIVYVILTIMFFFVIGVNISMFIDKSLPEKYDDNKLFKIGLISMIAIIIHNIPEGMATFISSYQDINLGILLTFSIALHNIPEGISIALPMYYSTNKKNKAFFYTLISGFSEVLGGIIAYFFLRPFINNITLGVLFAIIAGIMFQISIFSILKTSLSYKNYKLTFKYFLLGLIIVIITRIII